MLDRRWDVVLALAVAAGLIVEGELRSPSGLPPWAIVLALAAAASLAWRRRAPLVALAVAELGALLCAFALQASWAATVLVLVALYTVALRGSRNRSLLVGAVTAVGVVVAVILIDGRVETTGVALRVALTCGALVLGDTIRARRELREQDARRRVAGERLRIAQELHDTLAHSLVAINVRSSVALDLGETEDPRAALADVKRASADALRDLRATLSLLRDHADGAPIAPAYDLAALPGLVEHARSTGLDAELRVALEGAVVPSPIGAAAYRIVQEALTNVLRHAGASRASVRVTAADGALDIDVTDDGLPGSAAVSAGLGLRGMAERSAALGGRLDVGPLGQRGWRVHAVLPLRGEAA